MLVGITEQIRKWKKDNKNNSVDIEKLEILAKSIDEQNKFEWKLFEIEKEKTDLKNEKLKIEIERMKADKLFHTSKGNAFKLNDVAKIIHEDKWNDGYKMHEGGYIVYLLSDKQISGIPITIEEYNELKKQDDEITIK